MDLVLQLFSGLAEYLASMPRGQLILTAALIVLIYYLGFMSTTFSRKS